MAVETSSRLLQLLLLLLCAVSHGSVLGPSTSPSENEAAWAEAVDLLTQALHATKTPDHDTKLFRQSIEAYPQLAGSYNNLASLVLRSLNDPPRALELLRIGARVALETNDLTHYAVIETNTGQLTRQGLSQDMTACLQAITHFDRALSVEPMFISALVFKGSALLGLGRLDEAEKMLHRVITLEPLHETAHLDLGALHLTRGDINQALYHLEFVIRHSKSPELVSAAINNKVQCLMESGQFAEALKMCEQVLEYAPDDMFARTNLITARRTLCDWDGFEQLHDRLIERQQRDTEARIRTLALTPFNSILLDLSDSFRKTLAQFKSREFEQVGRTIDLIHQDKSETTLQYQCEKPLKIGYLSYDFRDHVMAQMTLGLIDHHDTRAVTTYCYSYGMDDSSELRKRVESGCDVFHDIRNISDLEAAQQIGFDQVDILIDLMAFTKGARLGLIALRPSRIIVNYLGYPGTMGSTFTDFAMVDRMVVPPEAAAETMTEQIVYLPHSYQANLYEETKPACSGYTDMESCMPSNRPIHGLPLDLIVFCNFNNISKMEPRSFATWMAILRRVLNSVLWLLEASIHEDIVRKAMYAEAKAHGVDPSRIIFAKRVGRQEHLSRLTLADIFLDSFIYNAHSTASDALWANLPIVTFWGNTFPSRVAAALISNAMEHSEIVVHSLKDYEDVAVTLAESIHVRRGIQNDLAANELGSPLFDSDRTANSVETAYQVMQDVTTHVDPEKIVHFQLVITPEVSREFKIAENTALRLKFMAKIHSIHASN